MPRNLVRAKAKGTHDFEKEKIVAGFLRRVEENAGEFGSSLYTLETETGERIAVWGNKIMDDQLATVSLNSRVQIEYLGVKKTKKGNREYKDFEVLYDSANSTTPESSSEEQLPF